jgi:O-acetyl-ADP-ribose deacetylase (regulator of RNase III)
MNKTNRSMSITARTIERDLKTLFQTEDCFAQSGTEADRVPSSYSCEQALQLFDRLREKPNRTAPMPKASTWTHPSVLGLGESDPVAGIIARARQMVLRAIERGWSGPPYNPLTLAEMRGVALLPTEEVLDARTRSDSRGRFTIEFSPNRPAARMRYSIAHELGHTLFPDCAEAIRNRATHQEMKEDDWQLESLCNIAAAEILMPFGTLQEELSIRPSVGLVLELRRKYSVSCEAVVNRLIRLSTYPCFAFLARFDTKRSRHFVEYRIVSPVLERSIPIHSGSVLPKSSRAIACTALGERLQEDAKWISSDDPWFVEYLGISANAGGTVPRVLGLASLPPSPKGVSRDSLIFLHGDATEPFGTELKILVQVVNDKAQIWGGGFARQIRKKWPKAQAEFRDWTFQRGNLKLGNVHSVHLRDDLILASLVSQQGFGESTSGPRLRYGALFNALEQVADLSTSNAATIHMPRIGAGEAGGSWNIIEGIIREALVSKGIKVVVYDLPSRSKEFPRQPAFEFPQELVDEVL